jgi:sRNA-binding carbon storage regulator CsrA
LGIEAPAAVHIVRGELRPFDEDHDGKAISTAAPIEMEGVAGPSMMTTTPHLPR